VTVAASIPGVGVVEKCATVVAGRSVRVSFLNLTGSGSHGSAAGSHSSY
jgi:hypothetical protein